MKQEIAVIFLLWFALQIPLGILIGKFVHFGMSEALNQQAASSQVRQDSVWRDKMVARQFCFAGMARSQCAINSESS